MKKIMSCTCTECQQTLFGYTSQFGKKKKKTDLRYQKETLNPNSFFEKSGLSEKSLNVESEY